MATLKDLEQCIFDVDGVRVELSGNGPVSAAYWQNRFRSDGTVADFRTRFSARYPGIDIVVYDGVGFAVHGNYLLKNVRATYAFDWIKREHANVIRAFVTLVEDQEQQIKALEKALGGSAQSATVMEEMFDPYKVLGIGPDSSDEEVKQAYQRRMQIFHPDKFSSMNPLIVELVNEQSQQINRARDEIARQRAKAA